MKSNSTLPIAVFDSGVGGLTVLRALRAQLPSESFLYLGDMARLPYGTKGPETIVRYALNAANYLIAQNIKLLVIACHTATSLALSTLQQHLSPLPVIGVLEPGAEAVCAITQNNQIAVIATEATVKAQGYQKAIKRLNPEATIITQGCSLFVALAEEGWVEGPIAEAIVQKYLQPIFNNNPRPDCLLLGCTHFPPLAGVIQKYLGSGVHIVDPAIETAHQVKVALQTKSLLNSQNPAQATTRFLVTDSPERFSKIAEKFLETTVSQVTQVNLVETFPISEESASTS